MSRAPRTSASTLAISVLPTPASPSSSSGRPSSRPGRRRSRARGRRHSRGRERCPGCRRCSRSPSGGGPRARRSEGSMSWRASVARERRPARLRGGVDGSGLSGYRRVGGRAAPVRLPRRRSRPESSRSPLGPTTRSDRRPGRYPDVSELRQGPDPVRRRHIARRGGTPRVRSAPCSTAPPADAANRRGRDRPTRSSRHLPARGPRTRVRDQVAARSRSAQQACEQFEVTPRRRHHARGGLREPRRAIHGGRFRHVLRPRKHRWMRRDAD